jgi:hypothetical protein
LPLPENLRQILQIEFEPPGKLSPGITWTMTLKLNPISDTDVASQVSLLTEYGTAAVPVHVRKRFADVRVSQRDISFGQILLNESAFRTVALRNVGASDAKYSITLTTLEEGSTDREGNQIPHVTTPEGISNEGPPVPGPPVAHEGLQRSPDAQTGQGAKVQYGQASQGSHRGGPQGEPALRPAVKPRDPVVASEAQPGHVSVETSRTIGAQSASSKAGTNTAAPALPGPPNASTAESGTNGIVKNLSPGGGSDVDQTLHGGSCEAEEDGEPCIESGGFRVYSPTGSVPGKSVVKIRVKFEAGRIGKSAAVVCVAVESADGSALMPASYRIEMQAECTVPPVFVENPSLDFLVRTKPRLLASRDS